MLVRVIYTDQTAGVVESHLLGGLIEKGRIVAYHSTDRWIAVEANTLSRQSGAKPGYPWGTEPIRRSYH